MSLNAAVEAIPRKSMVLFFLIDTSGSMGGSKIGAVNAAIEEVLPELKDISASNADAEVKIAVLEFANKAEWITNSGPVPVDNFNWIYVDACGNTSMGEALKKLDDALSVKTFMKDAVGSFAPAIFLLSDGEPTDDFDGALADLKTNQWFKAAIKVAVAIGDDANKTRLAEFTGSNESVLEVHSAVMLKKMIKFVSVRASQIASKSVQVSTLKHNASGSASAQASKLMASGNSVNPLQSSFNQAVSNGQIDEQIDKMKACSASGPADPFRQAALNEQLNQFKAMTANQGDDEW